MSRDPSIAIRTSIRSAIRVSIRFDLRLAPFAKTTFAAQHRAMLEMVSWADRVGVGTVCLSEHHGDPAGFTSAPLTLAAAVLARTERLKVSVAAALVPLHDPVRLAEQIATIDCLAPGRLAVVLGAGYRSAEFEMAGVPRRERGLRVEECVEVLRAAFTGLPFAFRGRTVRVTPPAATPGGPAISVGGKTEASARRAARLCCAYQPAVANHAVVAAYFDECEKQGFEGADVFGARSMADYRASHPAGSAAAPGFVMVSRDPEATWAAIGDLAVHDATTYAAWQEDGVVSDSAVPGASTADDLRASGQFAVVTPEECVALAERHGSLMLHPLMGGIEPDLAWTGLRLFEQTVLPRLGLA